MRLLFYACALLTVMIEGIQAGDAENLVLYKLLTSNAPLQDQVAALRKHFTPEQLRDGSAVAAFGGDFVFAVESEPPPSLVLDDKPPVVLRPLPQHLWVLTERLSTGTSHAHYYDVLGEVLGGKRFDTAAYGPDSYPQPGVPAGKLSEQHVITSQVYRGWKVSYWVYASPGVDPSLPAPFMVWQDGHRFVYPGNRSRLLTVVENLVHQNKIPPMVLLLIAPGYIGDFDNSKYVPNDDVNRMRSILYDTVNDDYNKMVLGEILPEVEKQYKLRGDGYSRGTAGQSSGGICAFNSAWWRPGAFSRVISRIGSFAALQWHHGQENPSHRWGLDNPADFLDGGNLYPTLVRTREKRSIRVWLEDGSYDHEIAPGSWPLQNIEMANSLKLREYDFHFSFGNNQHSTEHADAELPEAMTWLWRGYDPAKTEDPFPIDSEEKKKPFFRVTISNR